MPNHENIGNYTRTLAHQETIVNYTRTLARCCSLAHQQGPVVQIVHEH